MKTLTLLRHAKSGWDDTVSRDFDRPLNAKGRRAATIIGRQMRTLSLAFDHVVASPAVRVVETLDEIVAGYGRTLAPDWDRQLYLASAGTILDLVRDLPRGVDRALVIGHNPGLEDLVLLLTPDVTHPFRNAVEDKYPTASLAELQFDIDDWDDLTSGSARFTRFVRPRDLDPTLGPDAD